MSGCSRTPLYPTISGTAVQIHCGIAPILNITIVLGDVNEDYEAVIIP
jgi:hypothetical protein